MKINNLKTILVLFAVGSINIGYSKVATDESKEAVSNAINDNHDFIIGFLIFVIVLLQIVIFIWTQRRITVYNKAIDEKDKYHTVKLRIPVRWAESREINKILQNKDDYRIHEYNSESEIQSELIESETIQEAEVVEAENIDEIDDSETAENDEEVGDDSNNMDSEGDILDLFDQVEDVEEEQIQDEWVMIVRGEGEELETKRIKRKNIEKYEKLGWMNME